MFINKSQKIVIISDTHTQERNLVLPEGDILIHAGDFDVYNLDNVRVLNKWFNSLPFAHIIFVGGNHDFYFQNNKNIQQYFDKAIYLQNSGVEIEGLKFWGSPYSPEFFDWAFMYKRNSVEAKKLWEEMPENLDFLITHSPPYKILDANRRGEHCGCEVLCREVFKKNPKFHVFGHIHKSFPIYKKEINDTIFLNASLLDEDYKMAYDPIVLEL